MVMGEWGQRIFSLLRTPLDYLGGEGGGGGGGNLVYFSPVP